MTKVIFNNKHHVFQQAIKTKAAAYFAENEIKPTGNWKLYSKALILIFSAVAIYVFLLMGRYNAATGILLSIALGFCLCGIAMNVMHDANHGSFSSKKWVNNLMGLTMNALGSNAFLWKIKHNILHHTYTNIDGLDNDIIHSPALRQTPTQPWFPIHRYQHIYMYFLYAISTLHWMLLGDFQKYFTKQFIGMPIRKITGKEHVIFWLSKILYVVFYIYLPVYFTGWLAWLIGFLIIHFVLGLFLTIIFQLAHMVEKATFDSAGTGKKIIDSEWVIHEVKTTANFATKNKALTWFAGGLNFQVEHHLFPHISHVHYPALSKIIQEQCRLFKLPYNCYATLTEAIVSHTRLMKQLGKQPAGLKNY